MEGIRGKAENTERARTPSAGIRLYRHRKWQQKNRAENAKERNLAFALSELERVSMENDLPKRVTDLATEIYSKAVGKNIIRGRSSDCIIAVSVYSACRSTGTARTLEDIALSTGVSKKELGRTYRFLCRQLNLNITPARPQNYIQRFCIALGLSTKVQQQALKILDDAEGMISFSGMGPTGLAAAATYISSHINGESRSQSQVALAADISEVTLRSRYKDLCRALSITLEF